MILAHRIHPELAAPGRLAEVAPTREALVAEVVRLRERVAELEALLASATEPAPPKRKG